MKIVNKPWGSEYIWAENEKYAAKILLINKGHRLSLQYHEKKTETIMVDQGRLKLYWFEEGEPTPRIRTLIPGEFFEIRPGVRHRFEAIDNLRLIEVSTPELDDVVRIEDDYGR